MVGITFTHKGDFSKTEQFLNKLMKRDYLNVLDKYGQQGVEALRAATPRRTGVTANSWSYEITQSGDKTTISWTNSNRVNGVPIAIILQYGHGTRNGGFVQGRDYINPALRPIFEAIANDAWKEVTNA